MVKLLVCMHLSSQRSRVLFPVFPQISDCTEIVLACLIKQPDLTVHSGEIRMHVKTYIQGLMSSCDCISEAWSERSLECTSLILADL